MFKSKGTRGKGLKLPRVMRLSRGRHSLHPPLSLAGVVGSVRALDERLASEDDLAVAYQMTNWIKG